jgi:hypothetical protein
VFLSIGYQNFPHVTLTGGGFLFSDKIKRFKVSDNKTDNKNRKALIILSYLTSLPPSLARGLFLFLAKNIAALMYY